MKKGKTFRRASQLCIKPCALCIVLLLMSCSGRDYLTAIPSDCPAVISMDFAKMSGARNKALLKTLLHVSRVDDSGLDFSEKAYFFVAPDGNLGICMRVGAHDELSDFFSKLNAQGKSSPVVNRRGFRFAVVNHEWVAGFSDEALLIMGPTAPVQQAACQQRIADYLSQDEDRSIVGTKLFSVLDSIESPMAMVAQVQALPQMLTAPLMIGSPKDSDASQVLVSAAMHVEKNTLFVEGHPFSFNVRINDGIRSNVKVLRQINGNYLYSMPKSSSVGLFVNVEGTRFLPLLHANQSMQPLLAAFNSAIDIDNIIRSVDGDMAVFLTRSGEQQALSMSAKLAHSRWLADVDYWNESCPPGSSIAKWEANGYVFRDGKTAYYFGVTPDLQFFSGASPDEAHASIANSGHGLPGLITEKIKGSRLALVVNFPVLFSHEGHQDAADAVKNLMKPLFGDIETLVYIMQNE